MTSIIAAILAVAKAIPVVDKWFQQLVTAYVNAAIDRMSYEDQTALKKAVADHDQRELEKALGNPHAGDPSGLGDIRTTLPGVSH